MLGKTLAGGAAALLLLAGSGTARAADDTPTVPLLGISGGARTFTLDLRDDDAITMETRGGGGRGGSGGFRGGSVHAAGFRGGSFHAASFRGAGFRVASFNGFRANTFGGRNWGWAGRGWGWNRGWGGWGWGGWGWGGWGWGWPNGGGSFVYSYPVYYYPQVIVVGGESDSRSPSYYPDSGPMPPADPSSGYSPGNGTYPYNGGPNNPVPLPRKGVGPEQAPQPRTAPMDGRSVSLPAARFAYPAYGEESTRTRFAEDRGNPVVVQKR